MFLILISLLDAIILIPLNSEIRIIQKTLNDSALKKKIGLVVIQYFIPSFIGSLVSYAISFFYKEQVLRVISFVVQHTGGAGGQYVLDKIDPLYLLASKSMVPSIPMTTITYLAGARQSNIIHYIVIMFAVKAVRSIFIIVFTQNKTIMKTYVILELFKNIIYVVAASSVIQLATLLQYNNINMMS